MAFQGFGKNTGPIGPPKAQTPFGNFSRTPSPTPTFPPSSRPSGTLPKWGNGQKYVYHDYDAQAYQQSPEVVPPLPSVYAESALSASVRGSQVQDIRRTGPPTSFSSDAEILGASTTMRGRPSLPPFMRGNSSQSFQNFPIRLPHQRLPSIPTNYEPGRQIPVKHTDQVSKRTRSPPHSPPNVASFEKSALGLRESKRPSTSPSKLRSNVPLDSLAPQSSMSGYGVNVEVDLSKPMNFPVPKRTKFPSVPSSDQVLQYDSNHTDDDIQRETEAKAKRLARFKDDLSQQNVRDDSSIPQKGPSMSQYQSVVDRPKFSAEDNVDSTDDFSDGNLLSDYQGSESSGVIIGSCPDMCPESERAERERKGDLDQYERLDGDRNQTSKLLAVKKYTRTAEREALLIRPMPILQKTMDYLLNLLEGPYEESFLHLYNFLWDRMRAIRMDLRMQHIFNCEAINMLEQMIRLHIIAMHELCEYTRGEGFSEGFDAHLNIEQMNKTSVELFQLYDDHRKRRINVETEREFRGYYALLKLDKHPGYKVEPVELSLDLAKMTPDMRQSPEVLFARDVARACRTGNFIAFFRLARRASYLQACLMHAHFSKLRTQALASLHCGLQNSQGIPVAQVAKWLGMEEEDIEGLLEYYGFSLKEFEEPYMVKEGPFMEVDNDYPVKCSKLVHKKKSRTIFEDVSVPHVESVSEKETECLLDKDHQQKPTVVQFLEPDSSSLSIEENMPDYETVSSPKDEIKIIPITKTEFYQIRYESLQAPPGPAVSSLLAPPSPSVFFPHISPEVQQQARVRSAEKPELQLEARVGGSGKPKNYEVAQFDARSMPMQFIPARDERESSPVLPANSLVEDRELKHMFDEKNEDEELVITGEEAETNEQEASYYDGEVDETKLKLIIRKWKRRSSKKREMREEKQLASKAALSSLSLGVPMWPNRIQHSTTVEFNIDRAVSKWYRTQERSWSRLNVSDVVATTLHEKNAAARCLCWKVIICCQDNINNLNPINGVDQLNAKSWLLSKLMPAREDEDDTLITSPGLSVWRNWLLNESGGDLICCLSVIKYTNFENLNETVAGASAVLFLLSEGIPWVLQKNQLHKLLMSIPSGSQLPLLIVSELCKENADPSTIEKELELHEVRESRLHSFSVVYLKNQQMEQLKGFFSDEQLRGGLKWLASESPPQPVLQCVNARELVFYHLNSLLGVLGEMNAYDVGPNNCISAFNEALDQSMREIAAAAHANPTCWPCPEIGLLEEHSHEHEAVIQHLPKLGWSLAPRIEPVVCAISNCKFPSFLDDTSWLHRVSDVDVKNQILQLQSCLIKYFSEISKLMILPLAEKEASVMMQKFVQLQLQNSHYYIVPNWGMIFQRAFNWQLMKLVKETSFSVYILIKHDFSSSMLGAVELEDSAQSHYHLSHLSLDEMVEAVRIPLLGCAMLDGEGRAFQPYPGMTSHSEDFPTATGAGNEIEHGKDVGHVEFVQASYNTMEDLNEVQSEPLMTIKETKETDKLGELLERCKIKQNMIDKNLSAYF
ncbi:SAC3 family protein B isoform X2 [Solanum dulcamara]|uniref:SAC3 family protein B isoform X2 n=1 Tax=Solanum dulcamara TaxID=45834 RepID=UPI0024851692|nr:SAC3 family protein B isoform X2 [Solanum dulcamara]